MNEPRRFNEDEVRRLFDIATTAGDRIPPTARPSDGSFEMTLTEVQEIGREVGITPEEIADAVAALELRQSSPPRLMRMGAPIGVGRTVALERALTDDEWELLVVELRTTFSARGRLQQHGRLRSWNNGNLQILSEPTPTGHQLRMRTVKSLGEFLTVVGALSAAGGVLLLAALPFGAPAELLPTALTLAGAGIVGLVGAFVTLPPWAREREAQMERIAASARAIIARAPDHS